MQEPEVMYTFHYFIDNSSCSFRNTISICHHNIQMSKWCRSNRTTSHWRKL